MPVVSIGAIDIACATGKLRGNQDIRGHVAESRRHLEMLHPGQPLNHRLVFVKGNDIQAQRFLVQFAFILPPRLFTVKTTRETRSKRKRRTLVPSGKVQRLPAEIEFRILVLQTIQIVKENPIRLFHDVAHILASSHSSSSSRAWFYHTTTSKPGKMKWRVP